MRHREGVQAGMGAAKAFQAGGLVQTVPGQVALCTGLGRGPDDRGSWDGKVKPTQPGTGVKRLRHQATEADVKFWRRKCHGSEREFHSRS